MKSFKQIADQVERVYTLYLKGYGTKAMMERAERFFTSRQNVGLCF